MATNWAYIPLIGEPVALTNDVGDVIPRLIVPPLQGPPRKHKLKTYITLLNFATTAAPDDKVKITTRTPNALTLIEQTTNLNAFLPIITWVKGAFGPTQDWQVLQSTLVPGSSDLLECTLGLITAPLAPLQIVLCIDYSHSIVN